ncbi:MAG: sodium:proton antiporter, partial [Ignavibacteriales bacterium]|nr:sodium:proton antiporter [Ignavibacteriales bacterium]
MKHLVLRRFLIVLTLTLLGTISAFANEGYEVVPVNPLMIFPFVLLLLSIAIIPFINRHWWEKYYPHVSVVLGAISVVYYVFFLQNSGRILHTGIEYLSFIILIGSLFVVSGGIHIRIKGKSTPIANVTLLGIGAVTSNFLGTTGASMILIRPYL